MIAGSFSRAWHADDISRRAIKMFSRLPASFLCQCTSLSRATRVEERRVSRVFYRLLPIRRVVASSD